MKVVLYILGILFILVGLVWILQGFNVLLGSMMSGHIEYAVLGLLVAIIGAGLIVLASRRSRIVNGGSRAKLDR